MSHLPLIVIEPTSSSATAAGQRAHVRLIDNSSEENRPSDTGTSAVVTLLPHKPDADGKQGYTLVLDGGAMSLLGMPENDRWSLVGSNRDRGMLRNYLGSAIAHGLYAGDAPVMRFCEVLLKEEEGYRYQGLYLLSEEIVNGVWVAPGALTKGKTVIRVAAPGKPPRIVQTATGETVEADSGLEEKLSTIWLRLLSNDPDKYFSAIHSLDMDSFVNCYILARVMENRASEPFYLYRTRMGKIGMRPRLSFGQALDNSTVPAEDAPYGHGWDRWFDRLTASTQFVKAAEAKYYKMVRKNILGVKSFDQMMDSIQAWLGPALERDWLRWQDYYDADVRYALKPRVRDNGEPLSRQTHSPGQESLKLRRNLWAGDVPMRVSLRELHWREGLFTQANDVKRNLLYAGMFLLGFFIVVRYARNRM